jgi:hypothetical protein
MSARGRARFDKRETLEDRSGAFIAVFLWTSMDG